GEAAGVFLRAGGEQFVAVVMMSFGLVFGSVLKKVIIRFRHLFSFSRWTPLIKPRRSSFDCFSLSASSRADKGTRVRRKVAFGQYAHSNRVCRCSQDQEN